MTSPDTVARSRRRRTMLQARLRRQEEARVFRAVAPLLATDGRLRISRIPAGRMAALMAQYATWPARDERFYWPGIAGHTCIRWDGEDERDRAFIAGLDACFPSPTRLACIFHTYLSGLAIADGALRHAAPVLLDALYDVLWVVPASGEGPLLEVSLVDHEVCWSASPSASSERTAT